MAMYFQWRAVCGVLIVTLVILCSVVADKRNDENVFEYIVVGGGTAGCVLAYRLSRNHSVLLIEAGPLPPNVTAFPGKMFTLKKLPIKWNYRDTDRKPVYVSKVLGGTSTISLLIHTKSGRDVFEKMAVYDNVWNWDTLTPYFNRSEKLLDQAILAAPDRKYFGVDGRIGLTRELSTAINRYFPVFEELGPFVLSFNPDTPFGFTKMVTHVADGVRQNTASRYLRGANPGLRILTQAEVTQVTFKGKTATGVKVNLSNKTLSFKATKEVIVSAGAINTPKLLQASGIGPRKLLEELDIPVVSDLPVGENLQDNTILVLAHTFNKRNGTCQRKRSLVEYPLSSVLIATNARYSCRAPYLPLSLLATEGLADTLTDACLFFELPLKLCYKLSAQLKNKEVLLTTIKNYETTKKGYVKLGSKNPSESPLIKKDLYNEKDFEDMVEYSKDFDRIKDTERFVELGGSLFDFSFGECGEVGTDAFWRCHVRRWSRPFYHYCGTTSEMGGVVDGKLRVNGVKRLRVVDAGVFPIVPGEGPLPAVVLLAERAADLILKDR